MRARTTILSILAAAALSASAFAQDSHRVELKPSAPGVQGKPLPYTCYAALPH